MNNPYKKALHERRTYPPYPITGVWATVADVPTGAVVIDTTDGGKLKQSLYYLDSKGTDYINCGRPPFLSSLRPGVDLFTMRFIFFKDGSSSVDRQVFGLRGSNLQFAFNYGFGTTANRWAVRVGSGTALLFDKIIPDGKWSELVIKANTTVFNAYLNHELVGTQIVGTQIESVANLEIGRYSGQIFNGGFESLSFYSGVGDIGSPSVAGLTKLDCYDLSNWNGGPTLVSEKGNIATVTDGIPSTAHQKDLIPVEMKC